MELSASDKCPTSSQRGSSWDLTRTLLRLWSNFLKHPFDIVVPILLSNFFIGIFVAESTGTALSARIIGDSTALSDSSRCFAPNITRFSQRALAYVDRCYHTALGTEGCDFTIRARGTKNNP